MREVPWPAARTQNLGREVVISAGPKLLLVALGLALCLGELTLPFWEESRSDLEK